MADTKGEMPNGGKGESGEDEAERARRGGKAGRTEIEGKREEGIAGIPAKTGHTQETGNKEEGGRKQKIPHSGEGEGDN